MLNFLTNLYLETIGIPTSIDEGAKTTISQGITCITVSLMILLIVIICLFKFKKFTITSEENENVSLIIAPIIIIIIGFFVVNYGINQVATPDKEFYRATQTISILSLKLSASPEYSGSFVLGTGEMKG
jgi:ACR3 family arsenite efflux pump ArsB